MRRLAGGEGPGVEELEEGESYLGVCSVERGMAGGGIPVAVRGRKQADEHHHDE